MRIQFIIALSFLLATLHVATAQLATVYVDAVNGSDSFTGANPTNVPSGTGPKANIHTGLSQLADKGRLVIFAGTYAGDGIDTDGSPSDSTDNADINISAAKYPRLLTGLTIELRTLDANHEVRIFADAGTVSAPNGALINHTADQYIPDFILNIPGGTLTFTTTTGSEYLSLAGRNSSGSRVANVSLLAGTFELVKSSAFQLTSGATITIAGTARISSEAPQKGNDINVLYRGGGSITAGAESGYASFGSGSLTVSKDSSSTITFPYLTAFAGNNEGLRLLSGNAVFNSPLSFGTVGSTSVAARTADLIIATGGAVVFNAPVTMVVAGGSVHDSTMSTIANRGTGAVTFNQPVTWYASAVTNDATFPASQTTSIVWNAGNGSITFSSGVLLSHAATTNSVAATVQVSVQNNGPGLLRFNAPVQVSPRVAGNLIGKQQFSVVAINAGNGTMEISGDLRSGLVNGLAAPSNGIVNLTGATRLGEVGTSTGALVNTRGGVMNLGSNTLTLAGNVNHLVGGSIVRGTNANILVTADGAVSFDSGVLPQVTIQQAPQGSTNFSGAVTLDALVMKSGNCLLQSSVSIARNVEVDGGSMTVAGAATMAALDVNSGTCTFQSTLTIAGNVGVNGGSLNVSGTASMAALTVTSGVSTFQSTLTIAGNVGVNGGSLNVSGTASMAALTVTSGVSTFQSSVNIAGGVQVTDGSLTLDDHPGISMLVSSFRQSGGSIVLGGSQGGVLRILGDFTRTGGAFTAGTSSNVIFAGTTQQTVNPGAGLQLASLEIQNSGGVVRCLQPIRVLANLTIDLGSRFDLGSSTVVLNGGSGIFTNNGSFDATGLGIVLGGANSVAGGAALSGSEIRAGDGARFSSFTIDIGSGNVCALKATENVTWGGSLTLISGALDLASAVAFSPATLQSKLTIDVVRSKGITRSGGSFNPTGSHFTLQLTGALQSDLTLALELVSDLPNVDTLQIDVNGDADDNDGSLLTGKPRFLQFPRGVFVYGGSLEVGPTAAVRLEGGGRGGSIELTGAAASHRVRGILTTADPADAIVISGEGASLTGSAIPGEAALIGNIAIRSVSLCTISAVRGFLGTFTCLPGSTVQLSMGASAAEQKIAGPLVLNGSQFTLGSNIEVQGGVAFNKGNLNFGIYNLQVTTSGDFLQSAAAAGYTAAGGSLIMNRPDARLRIGSSDQLGIPNLQILARTQLDTVGRVTKTLTVGSKDSNGIPTLVLGQVGNDLIFTGSTITLQSNGTRNREAIRSDGTSNGTPGGRLFIIGTSVTLIMNNDFSIEELVYNPPAIDGTLSLLSVDQTPHVLTISDILTHAGGQIGLGFNHLALTGTGLTAGVSAYNRSDGTIGASTGEFRFIGGNGPQMFFSGIGFSVPNLSISNPQGVRKSPGSAPMIITEKLDLSDGVFSFDAGTVIIENNATVIRRKTSAQLSNPPSYRSFASLWYLVDSTIGNIRTGTELPPSPTIINVLRINNSNLSLDSSSVAVTGDLVVKDAIILDGGKLDLGSSTATLMDGGLVEVNGGRVKDAVGGQGKLVVSNYNLVYSKSTVITPTSQEFQNGPQISVARLSILGNGTQSPTVVRLDVNRTVQKLFINSINGGIEFGAPGSFVARNLTIKDSADILQGGFSSTTGSSSIISFAGTLPQVFGVPDSGLALQGGASAIHLQLNNQGGVQLQRGDLSFGSGSILFFVSGVLDAGTRSVVLSHTATSQGFDRQGVTGSSVSHIVGRIRQTVTGGAGDPNIYPNGRYEFPTGSVNKYRPLILTFTSAYPARNPGIIEIAHVDASPAGTNGLPLDGGLGVRIGSYTPYYWRMTSSPGSFGSDQRFDLELSTEASGLRISKATDARMILRADGPPATSAWNLLGLGSMYGLNNLSVTPKGDTVLTVHVQGANYILDGTNLLAIGTPSDRKPYLVFRLPATISQVPYNIPTTFKVSIADPDNKPLSVEWKVNGVSMKNGVDTAFTYTFAGSNVTQSVRAVFRNSDGVADSTEWNFVIVNVEKDDSDLPTMFLLHQNYPNPFNPGTSINYELPENSFVSLKVYDILGREVAVLVEGLRSRGSYTARWDATGMPSGAYLCRLTANAPGVSGSQQFVATRRLLLAK
jgi:hypothetical protein